jgi:hypothetical protein
MKRQLVLSLAFLFVLALAAPAVSYALESDNAIIIVDNKEKKEKKQEAKTEKKADSAAAKEKTSCPEAAKKAGCSEAQKSESKACTGEQKPCCASKKSE